MRSSHERRPLLAIVLIALALPFVAVNPPPAAAIGCITNCSTLTFSSGGNGNGTIQSTYTLYGGQTPPSNPWATFDGVINCTRSAGSTTGKCSHTYQNTYPPQTIRVYLVLTAGDYSKTCFDAAGTSCTSEPAYLTWIDFYASTNDSTRTFWLTNPRTLNVSKAGSGTGTVTSSPAGINCGSTCSVQFGYSEAITLTETPTGGSVFAGWSGGCTGSSATCMFTISSTTAVTATFVAAPTPSPAPTSTPKPPPTPSSSPTPAPTSTLSPGLTPRPTSSPGATNHGSGTPSPGLSVPPGAGASGQPAPSGSAEAPATSGEGGATVGSPAPGQTAETPGAQTVAPAGNQSSDTLLIVVAILGGAVIVAGGVFFGLRSRRPA